MEYSTAGRVEGIIADRFQGVTWRVGAGPKSLDAVRSEVSLKFKEKDVSSSEKPVVIAGGGLGGLSTALAFARQGWRVSIHEQAPHFGAIGYGIQLGPNVFPMFERLGVHERVLSQAFIPSGLAMRDWQSGEQIIHIPTGDGYRARFGNPYAVVHRMDLHEALLDACHADGLIEMADSSPVTGFEDRDDGVRVFYGDGQSTDAKLLVGADGLRSIVRADLVADEDPLPTGYVAYRTLVPMDEVPEHVRSTDVTLWSGPGLHIVHYPLRRGELFNIVAVFKTSRHEVRDAPDLYQRELQETYANSHASMKTLLSLMSLERRWPIVDRNPVRNWVRGNVCLLGDAAHPTLQSLAQGAGMAIEDAVHLAARVVERPDDIPEALRNYARGRYLRASRVQLESRQLWEFFHLEDPIAIEVRNQQQAELGTEDYYKCLNWLWAGVPVPAMRTREPA